MLYKGNQMPPVLTNNSVHSNSAPLNIAPLQPIPPMMPTHFPTATQDVDLRSVVDPRLNRNMDLDMRAMPPNAVPTTNLLDPTYLRQQQVPQRSLPASATFPSDPRQRADPRVKTASSTPVQHVQPQPPTLPVPNPQTSLPNRIPTGIPNDASDQEKAALIMQVLQLSDDQIAMLSPEQRNSILVLKDQIAKSTQR